MKTRHGKTSPKTKTVPNHPTTCADSPLCRSPLICRVLTTPAERQRFDELLQAEHFLGPRFPAGDRLYQVVEQDGQWMGLLLWCASAWHLKDRDTWIGWDPLTRACRLKLVVNQARFLVPEAARRPNLPSQVLSVASRALPSQWWAAFGYAPLLAETFTDPEAHAGTCYKAANWIAVGQTAGFGRHRCDFFLFHDRPKRLWLYPLDPHARQKLCAPDLCERHASGQTDGAGVRCALSVAQQSSLADALRQVPDPRRKAGRRYPLAPMLLIVALGLLSGAQQLAEIHRRGTRLSQRQRRQLGFWPKKGTRFYPVAGYHCLRDLLCILDLEALARVLTEWLQAQAGRLPRTLAVDGKTIRDHLGLIVSLVDQEDGVPVAVAAAPHKGHELTCTQHLLSSDAVDLTGALVTADSLHCQDKTMQIITQCKGGDFLIQVKGNQPTALQVAEQKLAGVTPLLSRTISAMDASNDGRSAL